ncbi:RanGTP-binding protein-domain-containing protein [Chaetomidium leptoderma]|uniref:RanGTP-binding protein-domain-containing protein n=1 Tax=Chaetomidium leptoderma TaxID=669021 RepID=A0AAN6VVT9_9PEZI|nr:RanGTP-binding protein-domain-containing protein [Chaetomidium leptoderma]
MDALLQTLGVQTFNYALRSGIALTSRYAVQQCSRLLKSVSDKAVRTELRALQGLLDCKIKILIPALNLIEFRSGRGNVSLESAVPLAKSLHREIVRLGKRLDNAATAEEETHDANPRSRGARVSDAHHAEVLLIIRDIKDLLGRIDRDVPFLQLAITMSAEMSATMTPGISPSRMMQASALLSFADSHFVMDPSHPMQIGSSFTLSLYMLFRGHSQVGPGPRTGDASPLSTTDSEKDVPRDAPYGLGEGERKPIWQEVMHKARVRLCRTPTDWAFDPARGYRPNAIHASHHSGKSTVPLLGPSDGYSYHLEIIEDLEDGRLHDGDGPKPRPFDDMAMAGIRESIAIHQISKIFYTDTGRILNIGNNDEWDNNPVLLLKREVNAKSPIEMRQDWFDDPDTEGADESQSDIADESSGPDDQDDVDRQLWEETEHSSESPGSQNGLRTTYLPPHLDPEWLALEVYLDDGGDEDEDDEEEDDACSGSEGPRRALTNYPQASRDGLSVDSKLMDQVRRICIRSDSPVQDLIDQDPAELQKPHKAIAGSYVTRSPFGSITSSLSLLEMLVRLTSLQEFQQTSHLAIPDHILTFFLEETSTTGLQGEAHWQMRSEAKRRMGFDPYTDSLPKRDGE